MYIDELLYLYRFLSPGLVANGHCVLCIHTFFYPVSSYFCASSQLDLRLKMAVES